jgi:hypothetical protein
MRAVGCGDDDQLDGSICEEFFDGSTGLDSGIALRCGVFGSFDYGGEFEAVDG